MSWESSIPKTSEMLKNSTHFPPLFHHFADSAGQFHVFQSCLMCYKKIKKHFLVSCTDGVQPVIQPAVFCLGFFLGVFFLYVVTFPCIFLMSKLFLVWGVHPKLRSVTAAYTYTVMYTALIKMSPHFCSLY